jgi:hypothetical protein
VVLPEDVEQLFVGEFGGVIVHFDRFGVACAVGADVFVGRALGGSAGVTDAG